MQHPTQIIDSNARASTIPASSILREKEVAARTGLSRTRRWELERDGKFPRRVRIGERSVGWHSCEIDEWALSLQRGGPARVAADTTQ